MKKKIFLIPLAMFMTAGAIGMAGCDSKKPEPDPTPQTQTLESIDVTKQPTKLVYQVGDTFDPAGLEVQAKYSDGSTKVLAGTEYTISPLTALTEDSKVITIEYTEGGVTRYAEIDITVTSGEIIPVTDIKYTLSKYSIEIDEEISITVTVEPENATVKAVTYEFDSSIISIENGKIKGLKEGSTDIIIKSASNPDITRKISNFKVIGHSIALPTSTSKGYEMVESGDLNDGDFVQFIVEYGGKIYGMPTYTTGKNNISGQELSVASDVVDDSASNGLYIVVKNADNTYSFQDSNGKYLDACGGTKNNYLKVSDTIVDTAKFNVAIADGKATIVCADSATTRSYFYFNGSSSLFSCYVEKTGDEAKAYPLVSLFTKAPEQTVVTGVEFNKASYGLDVGSSATVSARVLPVEATDKEISYSLKDVSPAGCVTLEGAVLTGFAAGTATVVATSHDGGFTAEAAVTVESVNYGSEAAPLSVTEALAIINNQCKASGDFTRKEIYCTGVVSTLGEKQSYGYKNTHISDGTSDVLIYSLNLNAEQLAAYALGKTVVFHGYATNYGGTIEFSTYNGNVYVTASYVGDPIVHVTGVSLDQESLSLEAGTAAVQLSATVAPEEATNKDVSWSSNNESVATVNSDGYVTPVAEGNAIITVTTADGEKTAECTVEVTPKTKSITTVEILNAPEKTTYYVREALDLTGLKLRVHYDNETSDDVTTGFTTNIEDGASLALTDTSLVVSYGGVAADAITLTINDYADGCHEAVVLAASLEPGKMSTRTVQLSGRIMFKPGNNLIIQDGDHAVIVYKDGQSTAAMELGKKVSMECKIQNYNGAAETEKLANAAVTVSDDVVTYNKGAVTSSEEMDAYPQSNIADFSNLIIKSKPALASGADGSFMVAFEDAPEKEYTFFMKKSLYNADMVAVLNDMEVGGKFSITNAYVSVYKNAAQICSGTESVATDKTVYDAESVSIYKGADDVTGSSITIGIEESVELSAVVLPEKASQDVTWAIQSGQDYVSLVGSTVTGVAETTDGAVIRAMSSSKTEVYAEVTVKVQAVHEVTSLAISGDMKTAYTTEDTAYDVSGLTVTATYNNDPMDTEDVTDKVAWSYDPAFSADVVASKDVTVTASFDGQSANKVVTISVEEYVANVSDELTADTFLAPDSSGYVAFENIASTAGIKYSGKATRNTGDHNGALQLNTSSNQSCIFTSLSNREVKKVSAVFNGDNTKKISVYGKDVSFSSNDTTGATLLGELSATGSFDVTGSYRNILIVSNGAVYLDSITVEWDSTVLENKVESISLSESEKTIGVGETTAFDLVAKLDGIGDPGSVTWSSDSEHATVSNGHVVGVSAGTANITATSVLNSSLKATCVVTVTEGKTETTVYDLDTTLEANKGSNTSYTSSKDETFEGVTWNVVGNTGQSPWRIGGKKSSGQENFTADRVLYTKTAASSTLDIDKAILTFGTASNKTMFGNVTFEVYSTAAGAAEGGETDRIFSDTQQGVASSSLTFTAAENTSWKNCYFRITIQVTISSTSAQYVQFTGFTLKGQN